MQIVLKSQYCKLFTRLVYHPREMLYYRQVEYTFLSYSPVATLTLGRKTGKKLNAGSVIALTGELGCGKTLLTRGICDGLRVPPLQVNSPTFVLVNEYLGRLPVFHIDLYRIAGESDVVELGITDYLRRGASGVVVIEWAEKVPALLPAGLLRVEFEILSASQRRIVFSSSGAGFDAVFKELYRP
jgi:tRNA threonylcarbamoyladenosine biosynthesis protein TsaE